MTEDRLGTVMKHMWGGGQVYQTDEDLGRPDFWRLVVSAS